MHSMFLYDGSFLLNYKVFIYLTISIQVHTKIMSA